MADDQMNPPFDEFMRDFDLPGLSRYGLAGGWPRVELSETETDVKLIVELPGMDERDIELTLADNMLMLEGEKKTESEGAVYSERWHGHFKRAVHLGAEIDPDKITAEFKKGVLTVTVAKRPNAHGTSKRIPIGT